MRFLTILLLAASTVAARPYLTASQVYINGMGPYRFLIDTGAQSTAVAERVARAAGIGPRYRVEQVTATGTRLTPAGIADKVAVGGCGVTEVEVLIGGVPPVERVDGVLGQSFLSRVNYLLDHNSGRFVIDPDLSGRTGISVPFETLNGRPAIMAEVGGRTQTLILDSGAPALVLFGVRQRSPTVGFGFVQTSAGSASAGMGSEMVRVGTLPARRVPTAYIPGNGPDRRAVGLLPTSAFRWVYFNNTERFVMFSLK